MHLALYRKYRPKTFDDVIGQDHITTILKNEVANLRPAHAYLFTGSRGTGKTSCAKIMAKALNCPNAKDGNPCNECDICRGIDDGSVMDVLEIDAASNNGVDNIRDLREEANFTPAVGKYRVYIIDETHMLSTGAFNALLKIMEEPPEHVIFILATTEVHKVPATVLSRCQRFDFRRITARELADHLMWVAGEEDLTLTEDAAFLIATLSDGGARDALSLLDLCSTHDGEITTELVTSTAGVVGQEHLFRLAEHIASQDSGSAIALIDDLSQRSLDPERLCEQLITHYRNLMIARSVRSPGELIRCLPSELPKYEEQSRRYEIGVLLYILSVLQEALNRMSRTALRKTELEMAIVRLCSPKLSQMPEAVMARLDQLETQICILNVGGTAPQLQAQPQQQAPVELTPEPKIEPVPEPTPESPKVVAPPEPHPKPEEDIPPPIGEPVLEMPPIPQPEIQPQAVPDPVPQPATPEPEGEDKQNVEKLGCWPEVLERLSRKNGALYGALVGSDAYIEGNRVLIDCKDDFFLTMMRENEYAKESLKQALLETTGRKFGVGPYQSKKHQVGPAEEVDPLKAFVESLELPEDVLEIT